MSKIGNFMKMLTTICSLIITSSLMTSCEKTPLPPSKCKLPDCSDTIKPPPVPIDTQVLWQTSFNESGACLSMYPILYKDNVVFSKRLTVAGEPILWLNKKTGKIEAEINRIENQTTSENGRHFFQNLWMQSYSGKYFQIIDLEAKKFNGVYYPRQQSGEGKPRLGGYGKHALMSWYSDITPEQEYTGYMVRANLETERLDTLFSITDTLCFSPTFESMTTWQNPATNDTLLIFQNRKFRFSGTPCAPNTSAWGRVAVCAYNLTQHKMEWAVDNVTPETGGSSVHPIVIHNNKAFFQGGKEPILFDCATGKIEWQRFFQNEGFLQTNSVIAEGKIIMKSETDNMIALDFETGNTVWENPKAGSSSSNMIYHKGRVYYETGDESGYSILRGLRVSDGTVIWSMRARNGSGSGYGLSGIAIDPETDLLYTSDKKFMQCIRLPK